MNQIENEAAMQPPEAVEAALGPVEPPTVCEPDNTGVSGSDDIHLVLAINHVSNEPTVQAEDSQDAEQSPEGWGVPAVVPGQEVPAVNAPAPLAPTKTVLADMTGAGATWQPFASSTKRKALPKSIDYKEISKQIDEAQAPSGPVWRRAVFRCADCRHRISFA
jgi:hypothetical protein